MQKKAKQITPNQAFILMAQVDQARYDIVYRDGNKVIPVAYMERRNGSTFFVRLMDSRDLGVDNTNTSFYQLPDGVDWWSDPKIEQYVEF